MYDAHNFEQVIDPGVCIYDAANFVTNGPTDGQADSRSWIYISVILDESVCDTYIFDP